MDLSDPYRHQRNQHYKNPNYSGVLTGVLYSTLYNGGEDERHLQRHNNNIKKRIYGLY